MLKTQKIFFFIGVSLKVTNRNQLISHIISLTVFLWPLPVSACLFVGLRGLLCQRQQRLTDRSLCFCSRVISLWLTLLPRLLEQSKWNWGILRVDRIINTIACRLRMSPVYFDPWKMKSCGMLRSLLDEQPWCTFSQQIPSHRYLLLL